MEQGLRKFQETRTSHGCPRSMISFNDTRPFPGAD